MRCRISSWNILHNLESTRIKKFAYCSPESLLARYRIPKIINRLLSLDSDIVCLQELDASILPSLEKAIASKYSIGAASLNESLPAGDGCGILYNPAAFDLVETRVVRFCDLLEKHLPSLGEYSRNSESAICLSRAMNREVREKLNMAVFSHLKHIETGDMLTVGSSHLYWDPAFPDIKLLQAYLLACESSDLSPNGPLVIGADLNSIPHASGVYELLMGSGKVPIHHKEHPVTYRSNSKNKTLKGVSPEAVPELSNPSIFRSGMKEWLGSEPTHTNYTSSFKGCLDYIMLRGPLKVVGGEPLPLDSVLSSEVALPNSVIPSDHLPLTVDLEFSPIS